MVKFPEYPLAQVLEIKEKRVEEAEKVVKEREEELLAEQDKLRQKELERDKVKEHKQDKLNQLRYTMDHECNTDEIQQMKAYLEVVKTKLEGEEKKVKEQQEQVKVAEQNLDDAKEDWRMKIKEVDKLKLHRQEWTKEVRKELELQEAAEMDEIGSIMFLSRMSQKEQ